MGEVSAIYLSATVFNVSLIFYTLGSFSLISLFIGVGSSFITSLFSYTSDVFLLKTGWFVNMILFFLMIVSLEILLIEDSMVFIGDYFSFFAETGC